MRVVPIALLCALATSAPALAATASSPPAAAAATTSGVGPFRWDFEKPGKMRDLVDKVLKVAWSFFPLAFIAALAVEAFGGAPTQPRDFAAVVWRAVVVAFLLLFYVPLLNGLTKHVFDPLAEAVTPVSGVGEFLAHAVAAAKGLPSSQAEHVLTEEGVAGAASALVEGEGFGGFFYDSLVSFLLLLAEGLIIVIGRLGKLFAALLFCLGPLALVAHLPRPSRTATRWFSHFVTVMSWPIFSGLLLSILVAMGSEGAETGGYLAAVVASLITAGMALATPRLASHVVGGTLENLIANGWASAKTIQRDATSPGVRDVVRSVVGEPRRDADGGIEWRAGVPQRVVAAVGSAVANGFRPPAFDPAAVASAAFERTHGQSAVTTNSVSATGVKSAPTAQPTGGPPSVDAGGSAPPANLPSGTGSGTPGRGVPS
jgi:hypothetical protein